MAQRKEKRAIAALIQRANAYEPRFVAITLAVVDPVNCARLAIPLFAFMSA